MDLSSMAFFERDGETLVPTALARGSWSQTAMHGVAISGALGRAAEQALEGLGRSDLRPTRWVVDLFRPALMTPCTLRTQVVREGKRLALIDVVLYQDDEPVARAGATYLRVSQTTEGEVWSPSPQSRPTPPPVDVAPPTDQPHPPYLRSDGEWTQERSAHTNSAHKQSWNSLPAVVVGERCTPFQAACAIADGSNLVLNWGTMGVEYINSDVTMTLARLPVSTEIGLSVTDRVESDGIAVGTAVMFDREGPLGTVVLTALANALRAVKPRSVLEDTPSRE